MNTNLTTRVVYLQGPGSILVYLAGERGHGWCSLTATNTPDGTCSCREFWHSRCCRHLRLAQAHYLAAMSTYAKYLQ